MNILEKGVAEAHQKVLKATLQWTCQWHQMWEEQLLVESHERLRHVINTRGKI
jgi:hypothetical protein